MNEPPFVALAEILGSLHAVETRLEAALEPMGLSLAKFKALHTLVAAGEPVPLRTLAEHCACVRSNITQLMDRLEADGLVQRVANPQDRRGTRAAVTPLGAQRQAAGARELARVQAELARTLNGLDPAALERALSAIE